MKACAILVIVAMTVATMVMIVVRVGTIVAEHEFCELRHLGILRS